MLEANADTVFMGLIMPDRESLIVQWRWVNLSQGKRGAIHANITLVGQPISQPSTLLDGRINPVHSVCFSVILGKNHAG